MGDGIGKMKSIIKVKIKSKKEKKEREIIMGMKMKQKTEMAIMKERLIYLSGKITIAKVNVKGIDYGNLLRHLGYKHNDAGELIQGDAEAKSLEDQYKNQYVMLAKKMEQFYEVVDKLPDEKSKYVSELRYVEGYSWKEIAKKLDITERSAIDYKDVLREYFIKNNCAWCLEYDKYSYRS